MVSQHPRARDIGDPAVLAAMRVVLRHLFLPEAAPLDAVIVTAAPGQVPEPLREQLAPGGPVGHAGRR